MRNLERDTQAVYVARYQGIVPQEIDGRLTGKNVVTRSEPVAFFPSVSMARGEAQGAYFGVDLDYDRVLTIDDPEFDIGEADVLWIESSPGDPEAEGYPAPHDHVVRKIARKGSYTVIAAKRVEVRS